MPEIRFIRDVDGYKKGQIVTTLGIGVCDVYVNRRQVAEYYTPTPQPSLRALFAQAKEAVAGTGTKSDPKPIKTRDIPGPKDTRRKPAAA